MAEPRIRHPLRTAALVAAVLVAAGAGGLATTLPRVIQWVAVSALDAMGVGPAALSVEQAGWHRLNVAAIRIGDVYPITVDEVTVEYSISGLLSRHLDTIRVQGLGLKVRVTKAGLSFGPVDRLLKGERGGRPWTIGTVQIRDSHLTLVTTAGDVATTLEGSVQNQGGARYRGTVHLSGSAKMGDTSEGPARITGRVFFDVSPDVISAVRAELSAIDPPLPLIRARQADLVASLDDRALKVHMAIATDQGRIELEGEGPPISEPLTEYGGNGTIGLKVAGLDLPGIADGLSITGKWAVSYAGKTLDVRGTVPLMASVSGLSGNMVPPSLKPWIRAPIALRVEGLALHASPDGKGFQVGGQTGFTLATQDSQSVKGTVAGSFLMDAQGRVSPSQPMHLAATYSAPKLSVPGARLTGPRASVAGRLGMSGGHWAFDLAAPMALSAKEIAVEEGAAILRNFRAQVLQNKRPLLTLADDDPESVRLEARAAIPEFEMKAAGVAAKVAVPRLTIRAGREQAGGPLPISTQVSGGEITLPSYGVTITGIEASANSLPVPTFTVHAAEAQHLATPPQVVPLRLSGNATVKGRRVTFAGRASDALGRLVTMVSGQHVLDTRMGSARVKLYPLTFLPAAVQPRQLFPALGRRLSAVAGTIAAEGPVSWSGSRLSSDLRLSLKDLSFSMDDMVVEGLNAAVTLDSPWPPSTPPAQTVRVKQIKVGVPLSDGTATYRLDPHGRLLLQRAAFRLMGGEVSTGSLVIDPDIMTVDTVLDVSNIDLADILNFANVEGVSGTGRLSGHVPIRYADGALSVRHGAIVADGPGVLRYAPETLPPALQGGDERISLLLGALKNFQYETLRLDLDRATGGEWSARLHLAGKNPVFKEGYPFEFNLNLSGALDDIVRKSLESYRHPERLGAEPSPAGR